MPKITHVKSARQRFETVPVLDEDGRPKVTPVMRRDGSPRLTKTGRPVSMAVTVADRGRPLPNLRCDFPGCEVDGGEILPGTPYKHISPRSGPYGGRQLSRHEEHPNWSVWDYSSSRSAQVAREQAEMHSLIDSWDGEGFDDLRQSLVDLAQGQADEQEEALSNMPEALQDGSQAQEYLEALEEWVSEIEACDEPEDEFEDCEECDGTGEREDLECEDCGGTGDAEDGGGCEGCGGTGEAEGECGACDGGKADVRSEDWLEAARDALREAVDSVAI
jgi:hypothetical protein